MNSGSEVSGRIGFLSFAGTLKELFQRRATGELVVSLDGTIKKLFFKNGIIIYASSNLEQDRLGDVLLQNGIISKAQYDDSGRQVVATGKKQGTLLVQMEAISPKDLFRGLNLQIRSIVLSLFDWEEGACSFSDELPPQEEIVTLRVQPAPLIVEGVLRRASETAKLRALWDPGSLDLKLQPDPPWLLEDLRLPVEAKKLLDSVGKGESWGKIPSLTGMSEEKAGAFLYALSVLELVSASAQAPGREEAAPAATKSPAAEDTSLAPPEKIEELSAGLGSLNLYQMLRLEPGANLDAVKESYLTLAKEFHPDRYFDDRYDPYRGKITSIFMRINEAYNVLSDAGKRAEYDRREIRLETSHREAGEPDRDSRIAKEQFRKGMETLKAGDPWTAIESFRWAVQLNPRNPLFHSWLGAALTSTGKRLHEAEEHCKTAIALDYSNPLFYLHLGQVYKTGKLAQKARKQFETALKLNPGFLQAGEELKDLDPPPGDKGIMNRIFRK
jgi:tetratricopeptide (TPR) repeat protein